MLKNKIKISEYDQEISKILKKEKKRQEEQINLIASENYASKIVMQAQGSQLTNKYAEGYPKKRYYEGCKFVDMIEKIAIKRAKLLFDADFANVQPHSGSQANEAVYMALLKPGDKILGLELTHGGHLTHGSKKNFSGKFYHPIYYGVNEFGEINYKEIYNQAIKHKPKLIICGFSTYSGIVNWSKIRKIADKIKAYFLVDMAHIAGLVAAKIYPNPIHFAHVVTATTHKTLAGPRGGLILAKNGNKEFYKKINSSVFPGVQGGPFMHIISAKAISFKEALEKKFIIYQKQIVKNTKIMAKIFLEKNFKIVSKKIENHLFLVDLTKKKITGKEAEFILSLANIITNKNTIPNDPKKPSITSGIRIGSAAITRRGFQEKESKKIAYWICNILNNIKNTKIIQETKKKVFKICKKFPIYK